MKEDLAAAELEWNYWFNAVKTRETELIQAFDSAEHRVYEIDTEDGIIIYDNGMDYWTYGQLTIVRNQMTELRQSLENTTDMTLEELQAAEEKYVLCRNNWHWWRMPHISMWLCLCHDMKQLQRLAVFLILIIR